MGYYSFRIKRFYHIMLVVKKMYPRLNQLTYFSCMCFFDSLTFSHSTPSHPDIFPLYNFPTDSIPPDNIPPRHFPTRTFSHYDIIPPGHFLTRHFPTRTCSQPDNFPPRHIPTFPDYSLRPFPT